MGIDPVFLPDNSPVIAQVYGFAKRIVDIDLCIAGVYTEAVYNFAGDQLLNYADDQDGRTFFDEARAKYSLDVFVPGVLSSSSNSPTSQATLNPEFMKTLVMGDLQTLKTPYGKVYMNLALQNGTIWGLS